MKVIIVNAVSATVGGAITILEQFLRAADPENVYHVFVSDAVKLEEFAGQGNMNFHNMGQLKGFRRFFWDYAGIARYLKRLGVVPNLIVSLQNTPSGCLREVPQVVYVHQGIPISGRKWALIGKGELVFWLYKHVYPIFMRGLPARQRYYVCQAEWMRADYAKLLGVPLDRVRAFAPQSAITAVGERPARHSGGRRIFFYPALGYGYKNHALIVDAFAWVNRHRPDAMKNLKVLLTLDAQVDRRIFEHVTSSGVGEHFVFAGSMPHAEVIRTFADPACVLLFPSEVETIGLPLLEAASQGCPIVAADLPYARDALAGYEGVSYLPLDDVEGWARAIIEHSEREPRSYPALQPPSRPSWKEFFAFLSQIAASS